MSSDIKNLLQPHLIQDLFSVAALGRHKQQQQGGDLKYLSDDFSKQKKIFVLVLPKIDLFLVLSIVHMRKHYCFSSIPVQYRSSYFQKRI